MSTKLKISHADHLNEGMKSIVHELKIAHDKLQKCEDNQDLCNQIQCILKYLSTENDNINYATDILNLKESIKNELSFYLNKTGTSSNTLSENSELDLAAKILQEIGIDDYKSSCLFTKFMSMIEKCNKKKECIDEIDEHINKLKIMIEQQNDLKCELSNITYSPVGLTTELINVKPMNQVQPIGNCEKIVKLIKKIADVENKHVDICKETSKLKLEQNKLYHGLPPNLEQATIAVQMAEKSLNSMSKQFSEQFRK